MLAVAMVEVGLAVERGAEALVVAMALVMQAAAPRGDRYGTDALKPLRDAVALETRPL